jgi:predicted RNA-binding protein YlqC (UPF0109 family)
VASSIDQQFIEYIVKSLVSQPDKVKIERRIDEKGVLLELTVYPEDLGRVIGKRGATAQSLRTLLRALGTKNDARYNLKIVDTGRPAGGSYSTSDDNSAVANDTDQPTNGDDDLATSADEDATEDHSSVVSKTRKELEELDDLDV